MDTSTEGSEPFSSWQNEILKLNKREIEDPFLMAAKFFNKYSLFTARNQLKSLVTAILKQAEENAENHFFYCIHLERLLEAVYLIHSNYQRKLLAMPEDKTEDDTDDTESTHYKVPRFEEIATWNPLVGVSIAFEQITLNKLMQQMHEWKRAALTRDQSIYDNTRQRERFLVFYDGMELLVEAMFLINGLNSTDEKETSIEELKQLNTSMRLSKDQMENPMLVMCHFFSQFSITYARRELWDWMESVDGDSRTEYLIDHVNFIFYYRCLLCIMEAAFVLYKDNKKKQDNDSEQEANRTEKSTDLVKADITQPLDIKEAIADINKKIIMKIRQFFLDTPLQNCKYFLWGLYRGWVHNSPGVSEASEHSDTLLFYEELWYLLDYISDLLEKQKQLAKRQN